MAKNKEIRTLITIECTDCRQRDNSKDTNVNVHNFRAGNLRYYTTKNRRNNPERITLKKYCPKCNKHTLHNEIK